MRWNLATKIPQKVRLELKSYTELESQLLYNRGIETKARAEEFFNLSKSRLRNPINIPGIQKAFERILEALKNKEKVFVYGDYDVDGVCATSIMFDFLYRKLGLNVLPYIPNRFEEGYGMSSIGLDHIVAEGGDLIITVDCGIRDREIVEQYKQKGLDFIITDHHSFEYDSENNPVIPNAVSVVHPKLPGSEYEFSEICGAAVAWKLVLFTAQEALKQGLINKEVKIEEYIDLVALATVCDIMPLVDENRVIVALALDSIKKERNKGLEALMNIAGVDPNDIQTYHFGYVIGPRINAGGRIEHALEGVRLLTSNVDSKIEALANKLDRLNLHRQKLTQDLIQEAEAQIVEKLEDKLFFVHGEQWPEGIVGLVAGKLTEKYHRPVLAASIDKGIVKGSARSIKALNVTEAISLSAEILEKYGGHHQAAGFTLKYEHLEQFKLNIKLHANQVLTEDDLIKEVQVDAHLQPEDLSMDLILMLDKFKPFGFGNFEPVFMITGLKVLSGKVIGKHSGHIKITALAGDQKIDCIGFNMAEEFPNPNDYGTIDVIGSLSINTWNNTSNLQIKLKDLKHV